MDNIKRIDIVINEMKLHIYPHEHIMEKGKINSSIKDDEIETLLSIISLWKNEYYSSRFADGNHFTIKINYDNDVVRVINGVGAVPENYEEFYEFVRDLYARK